MRSSKAIRIAVALLSLGLICAVGFLVHAVRQNAAWEANIHELAGYKGVHRAMTDFDAGRLRIYVLSGRNLEDKFTGTNEGPFEVWISHCFPEEPYPARFALEKGVSSY
jgi:hypothetical protein